METGISELFQAYPALLAIGAAVIGLIIGSFLNVVILRLPVMLEREWRAQCAEAFGGEPAAPAEPFNLAAPPSTCPQCGHRIRPWENIPVLSYVILRGRCAACQARISPRYPLIELLSAVLSVVVVLHFGFTWDAAAALLLTWVLIALSFIDIDHQLLPDAVTMPVLWLGLILSLFGLFVEPQASIIGAVAGYLVLWSVYQLFKLATGKEGMGYGDFKLLALFGAWLGWQVLPLIILLASLVGAVIGLLIILLQGRDRNAPLPFGPYLAAAGWIALLWGDTIMAAYLDYAVRV